MRQRLGVNVDHIATIRQARRTRYPDPVEAAMIAERVGADQITVHLREDRRHIQERDVEILRKTVTTLLNLEMAATQEMVRIALELRPDTVTLVPERREELTTEGGLDVVAQKENLKGTIRLLRDADIRVSLFIDADLDQVRASHKLDADAIEIHTGQYAEAPTDAGRSDELRRIVDASKMGKRLGLDICAGHGLDYVNTRAIAGVKEIAELNIGHSLIARAMIVGMERAVSDMLALMREYSDAS
ncbi:MAG: pyridoxine 5'-phosphate synthase [Myxococcota bacterium]|nr:pyridoxine 5'-phosphate synthase [Myxococcota bacterium]